MSEQTDKVIFWGTLAVALAFLVGHVGGFHHGARAAIIERARIIQSDGLALSFNKRRSVFEEMETNRPCFQLAPGQTNIYGVLFEESDGTLHELSNACPVAGGVTSANFRASVSSPAAGRDCPPDTFPEAVGIEEFRARDAALAAIARAMVESALASITNGAPASTEGGRQ